MTDWADIAVFWTARAALLLYVVALLVRLTRPSPNDRPPGRWLWTAGYVIFLTHLIAAFHFVHHWSHEAAYEETARRTYDALGIAVGVGIYVNHLFAVVWGIDVAWMWFGPTSYVRRRRGVEIAVQGFLAFIAFNSTVVFGHGVVRWVGILATVILAVAVVRFGSRSPSARC
jgi:hypothetical protein